MQRLTMRKTYRIAVSGYYGCGNAGDEAVLAGIRASFARVAGEEVELIALSQNPEETTRLHGVAARYRMSFKTLRETLQESDMLLSGGGSLLQDTTSVRSLLYYLWVCRLAMRRKVPVVFYAQGMGPLHRSLSRKLVQYVANRCAFITVRDSASAELLKEIGVHNPNLEITTDPAFALLPSPSEQVDSLLAQEGLPIDRPLLGVALRAWGQQQDSIEAAKAYARLLEAIHAKTGLSIVLLPMHVPDDVEFGSAVLHHITNSESFFAIQKAYSPETLLGLVSRLQGVVAMRLHTLIFAARVAVPAFALSYDPKVRALMESLGLENYCAEWKGFDTEEIAERVSEMLVEREKRVDHLQKLAPLLEVKALRSAERVMEILQQK
ncbi:MAG: polysaccharide pyruvyl transferase CsaB [Armatimonadetes bacterium]|nr:polysaccharide pyruvyl transferase CsaB [Armatimonadota bacterium]